jgi:hypothetical protein
MKADASAGLLDASTVRDLISKTSEEAPVPQVTEAGETVLDNGIVLKGSASAMAAFIHAASDRPAPTPADVAKAKNDTADREKKAASGAAMDDGSYPIADKADLGKAIHAVGRGGASHDAIRKHIISRARSLGASSEIPDNWNSDGSLKGDVSKEAAVPAAAVTKDMMDTAGDAVMLDDGMDGMDPTVPLAAPDDEMDLPGDPTDPGSPAWEGIDAASAGKWLSIAARLKNALGVLAEREMLEAASADPDDIENAWNLQDAMCAVDFAIEQLAVFAAGEQAEAELGAECEAMCKALAGFDTAPLDAFEGLAAVRKAGRVLSSANENRIREAAQSLQDVLASLPAAPAAPDQPVAKEKGALMPVTTAGAPAATVTKTASPEEQALDTGPVNAGGTTGLGQPRATGPDAALPGDGPQAALPGDVAGRQVVKASHLSVVVYDRAGKQCHVRPDAIVAPVAKADGDDAEKPKMQAVFDQDGDLIGVVDPDAITPVAGAASPPAADPADAAPAPAADDMQPQPPADAGTPADAVGKGVAPEDVITVTRDVLKSIVAEAVSAAVDAAAPAQDVAKQADVAGALAQVDALRARIAKVEEQPAMPGVFTNGAVPPEGARPLPSQGQLRGQDQGAHQAVNVTKAVERKAELYSADGPGQVRISKEMQEEAIAALAAMHAGRQPAA